MRQCCIIIIMNFIAVLSIKLVHVECHSINQLTIMQVVNLLAIVATVYLRRVTAQNVPDCSDDQRIIFTAQPSDMKILCGVDEAVVFPCQYGGSTSKPQWIINSTVYNSLNSQLPPDHFYHNHTLSVRNIKLSQNTTNYQCQVIVFNGLLLCAHRSTIGRLIIKCRVISTSTVRNRATVTASFLQLNKESLATASILYPLPLKSSSYIVATSLTESPVVHNTMVLVGAITISTLCSLFVTVLIAIPVGLWCYKKHKSDKCCLMLRRNVNQENIYDEPSLPDPIYQEVTGINMSPEKQIEMMQNYSYITVRSKSGSTIILDQCPAYTTQQSDIIL